MKFIKLAVLATALAATVPSAFATRLYGSVSVSGTATIAGSGVYPTDVVTSITFANPTSGNTTPHYNQSKGGFISAETDFSEFDATSTTYFVAGASDNTQNGAHQYTNRTPAGYTFALPTVSNGGPPATGTTTYTNYVLTTPLQLFTVTEGSDVLVFYLTEIDTTTLGLAAVTTGAANLRHAATYGGFTGLGYVTVNGGPATYGTFSLQNSTAGTGRQAFSATFVAPTPEPSSLALLGTGVMGAAGVLFRKRRVA